MQFELDEGQRQLTLRGLAVQSLRAPGFEMACREIARALDGEELFDTLRRLRSDVEPPADDGLTHRFDPEG